MSKKGWKSRKIFSELHICLRADWSYREKRGKSVPLARKILYWCKSTFQMLILFWIFLTLLISSRSFTKLKWRRVHFYCFSFVSMESSTEQFITYLWEWVFLFSIYKICHLQEETRRNIALTKFGYDDMGTLQFNLGNFTVPDEVVSFKESRENRETDKFVSYFNG